MTEAERKLLIVTARVVDHIAMGWKPSALDRIALLQLREQVAAQLAAQQAAKEAQPAPAPEPAEGQS